MNTLRNLTGEKVHYGKPPKFWPKDVVDPDFEIVNSGRRKTVVTATNVLTRPIDF